MPDPETWRDFWNGETAIYAGARHLSLHYERIARELTPFLRASDHALDHGCGEALCAGAVADACERLYLFDAAPNVRQKLRARFGEDGRITIVEDEALEVIPDASLDLVIAGSLIQYLTQAEFASLLDLWRRKLNAKGRLLLVDVIPPDATLFADVRALLAFAFRGGFLFSATSALVRTFFSRYRRLRRELGFCCYSAEDLSDILQRRGFACVKLAHNLGHNQTRLSFLATKRDSPRASV